MSRGCPLDRWTGQDSGTSLVSEGGMSNGRPMDVCWTGKTILTKWTEDFDGKLGHEWLLASFPGPAQLSVTCNTKNWERAWYNLSRE